MTAYCIDGFTYRQTKINTTDAIGMVQAVIKWPLDKKQIMNKEERIHIKTSKKTIGETYG